MSVDIACGESAFLDLTFAGLEALPAPGEERHAVDLLRSAGGGAITAIGAARLGLDAALVSPLGRDPEGDFLRTSLRDAGVLWAGHLSERTAVTAVLPADGERSMATFDPGEAATAEEVAAVDPRAVVLSLPRLALTPPGARLYATAGDADARAGLGAAAAAALRSARALIVNAREARLLSGQADAEAAARRLAGDAPCVVVTLGPEGALAVTADGTVRVPGVRTDVVDTTGAGDLFTAAYIWADSQGAPLEERLRWAVLYAGLSVRVATAHAGAVTLAELAEAGTERGLAAPSPRRSDPIKEEAR